MISIKPTTSPSKDPDPASENYDATQVVFMNEPSQPEPAQQDQQKYQIASRVQGGQISLQTSIGQTPTAQQDVPAPALSDSYKKGLQNQTNVEEQELQGDVDIAQDAVIDHIKKEKQEIAVTPEQIIPPSQHESPTVTAIENLLEKIAIQQEKNLALQAEPAKIISKKHRPADLGDDNISKLQLSKPQGESNTKKKISLQDLQQGFSQFIKNSSAQIQQTNPTASTLGNSLYFSATGNAQQDDAQGLKFASYMNQAGKMYQSSGTEFVESVSRILQKEGLPRENNQILITIERSGKVSSCITTLSCGNPVIDNYHLKIIESIGFFPPIPKYIDAPLQVAAQIPFRNMRMQGRR